MRKVFNYETPEIEVTRFEVKTSVMTVNMGQGGITDGDGNDDQVPLPTEWVSMTDEITLPAVEDVPLF